MSHALQRLENARYQSGTRLPYGGLKNQDPFILLLLTLAGTFAVAGGDAAGTPLADGAQRQVADIMIRSGNREIIHLAGHTNARIEDFFAPTNAHYQDEPSNDTAGLSETVELNAPIPCNLPGCIDPEFAYIDPRRYGQKFEAQILYGTPEELIDGGTGAMTLTLSPANEVSVHIDRVFGTDYSPWEPYIAYASHDFTGNSNEKTFEFPDVPNDVKVAHVIVETLELGSDEYIPNDAIVSGDMRAYVGTSQIAGPVTWAAQRSRNAVDLKRSTRVSGAVLFSNMLDGMPVVERMWDAAAGSKLVAAVTNVSTPDPDRVVITVIGIRPRA